MLCLAAAIGEEAGLRASEVCRLRLEDVFFKEQRLFVRCPNKAMVERWALFGEKTKYYYIKWMAERRTDCDHDGLLHNHHGGRLKYGALRDEYLRTLSKVLRGKRGVQTGFDRWLTHRLRHTFATTLAEGGADAITIKGLGGWQSFQVMEGYIETNADGVGRGYHAAMKKAAEQKERPSTKRTLTLAELLKRKRAQQNQTEPEEQETLV
jgi:integrase